MWEAALAFAIWGSYGSVLTAAHIDPALTAIARSAGFGIILAAASVAIARLRGPREITAAIPWQSGALRLSGSVLLVDDVLYAVGAVSGPARRRAFQAGGADLCYRTVRKNARTSSTSSAGCSNAAK